MNHHSKLLILIPFKNEEQYLHRCLSSVKTQTFQNFTVLMSDNFSTDSSGVITETFAQNDQRFILFRHQKSETVGTNWNSLVKKLDYFDSEFVMWLSGDDYISDESYLENLMAVAEKHSQVDSFVPRFMNISQDGMLDLSHSFEVNFTNNWKVIRRLKLVTDWANCVSLYGMYRRNSFEFLAKSGKSKIQDDPESDWWWTFILSGRYVVLSVPDAIYVKTIKNIPYYRETEMNLGRKSGLRKWRTKIAPLRLLASIRSRGLSLPETISVILLSLILAFNLLISKLKQIEGKNE